MGVFQYFDHAADVGIRIAAPSREEVFRLAGRALMEWIGPAPDNREVWRQRIALEGENIEDLLVRWLQELLYLFHVDHAYMGEVPELEFRDLRLDATVEFRRWGQADGIQFQEVKAITYHQASVAPAMDGWEARVILDI